MKRILVSLFNKEKYLEMMKRLSEEGWDIWASSGTSNFLKKHNVKVKDISSITGFNNLLDGLIKTLHPEIFAGILGSNPRWDIVFVDVYPPPDVDIGGISLLRAAAKNWRRVKPAFDERTLKMAIENDDEKTRRKLAAMTFAYTSIYDSLRANLLENNVSISFAKSDISLRYGENPHEMAFVYGDPYFEIISEKRKISFNNILDAENAWFVVRNLKGPCAVVVKHQSVCGAAIGEDKMMVVKKAIEADSESSYGGILAVNFEMDEKTARNLKTYLEVIIAPSYTGKAIEILSKKRARILRIKDDYEFKVGRMAFGSILIGERKFPSEEFELIVGEDQNEKIIEDLHFAFVISESVKSNAVVIVKDGVTVGIGGGQPSRKRAAWLAVTFAQDKAKGAVAASDAFFPFPDGLEILASAGVKAVVAPLGSIRDKEVLKRAKELNITFYKAPGRVFRH